MSAQIWYPGTRNGKETTFLIYRADPSQPDGIMSDPTCTILAGPFHKRAEAQDWWYERDQQAENQKESQ